MRNNFEPNNDKPIFLQFAEQIENNILRGIYKEETQIPSTTEVSIKLKINPATANRGVNLLVEEGIIYKRRGIGMFVAGGAVEKIKSKRKDEFFSSYIRPLLKESANLDIDQNEIIDMIKRGNEG